MRSVQMLGHGKVAVKDVPDLRPEPGEVLIEVRASGLCGSELKGLKRDEAQQSNGGHEVAGVVVEANGTKHLKTGDRVGVHAVRGCGQCEWCAAGKYTYCDHKLPGGPGTHAELTTAPEHVCVKLPEDVPFDVGVLLSGDGLGVPYHVNTRLATRGGEVVCVIGLGPIGLGNVLVQAFVGAEVIAVDVNPYRMGLAKNLGAAHGVDASQADPFEAVRDITHGALAHKCVEAVGHPDTLQLALRCVGKRGMVMACGEQGDVAVNVSHDLIRRDIALAGSWFYHFSEFGDMLQLYRRGLRVADLITHRFSLEDAQEAFDMFAAGKTGKAMLEPNAG